MVRELEPQITLPWLVRLRWLAVLGQATAIGTARWVFDLDFPYGFLAALVFAAAASNAVLASLAARSEAAWSATRLLGAVLSFDTVLLTALLAASGGAMNPFTVLYLVHITLSAVVLNARWTTLIAALSIAGFGALFLVPATGHEHHAGANGLGHHLEGMWVAFVLAAALTAFFVRRIAQAIAHQREQIAILKQTSARNARLAAVTTLAAGAAHELGTPLGTIALAAHEARLAVDRIPGATAVSNDLELILLEVERCHAVLSQMAARVSDFSNDMRGLRAGALREHLTARLDAERRARVELRVNDEQAEIPVPADQTLQSIVALVRNALDASESHQSVLVELVRDGGEARITVEDHGTGIPEAVLARVGEPFFTTKQPGQGLGLGIFLARAFAESRGGSLVIESGQGIGTRALLRLPCAAASPEPAA